MSNDTQEPPLFFEDVLAETQTRRADWLIGVKNIAEFLDRDNSTVSTLITRRNLPTQKVKVFGERGGEGTWIVRVSDAQQYKDSHDKALKDRSPNGHSTPDTIILKEGSPLMSQQDSKELKLALWSLKASLDANTDALKKMTEKL